MTTPRTTRVRGLAAWSPRRDTLDLLDKVKAVLVEYRDHLSMTVRQIFYRLVGVHGYDKTEGAYSRLGEHLNRARRSCLISFDDIRDDGTTLAEPTAWADADDLIRACITTAERFKMDRQEGQPCRLIFGVEAAGMVPQVQRIADEFGIAVHSSGGFDSLTAKLDLAKSLGRWPDVEMLHIGDRDPSGVHMFSSAEEDICALVDDLGLPADIRFTRLCRDT